MGQDFEKAGQELKNVGHEFKKVEQELKKAGHVLKKAGQRLKNSNRLPNREGYDTATTILHSLINWKEFEHYS
uniref:Uncharacterized protein n=1 Tax=Romanomermis culicivorax TaxID=13658 RepID=A0A915JE37_ROMCU